MLSQGQNAITRRHFGVRLTMYGAGLLLWSAQAVGADPNPNDALGLVRTTTQLVMSEVKADEAAIQSDPVHAYRIVEKHVSPHVDLERSSRWVLGKHWRRASDAQKVRFIAEFRTLLLNTYATALAANPSVTIEFLPLKESRRKGVAIVRTRIPQQTGQPISVHYRMHSGKAGWKLFDVSIEGVSLVSTYRSSFSRMVKDRGLDGLIDDLATKNRARSDA